MKYIGWLLYLVYPLVIFAFYRRAALGWRINTVAAKFLYGVVALIGFFSYFWFVSNFNFLLVYEKVKSENLSYSSGVVWSVGSRNGVVISLVNGDKYYCDSKSSGACLISMREKAELKTQYGFMNGVEVIIGWRKFYDLRIIYSIEVGGRKYLTERESELRFDEQYNFAMQYTWVFLAVSVFCFIFFLMV